MHKNMRQKAARSTEGITGSYAFLWNVADSGYGLVTADTHEPVQKDGMDSTSPWFRASEAGTSVTRYSPLPEAELHRRFGGLHDDESIAEFANHYGMLGRNVFLAPHGGGEVVLGESLERWRHESRTLGILLAIWDMVQKEDAGKLGQIIIWPKTNDHVLLRLLAKYDDRSKQWAVAQCKGHPPDSIDTLLASTQINPELLERWQMGMPVEPAKYYVYREVNRRLTGHVAPQILPHLDDRICLFPDSLLSAFWVLFLMELTGSVRLRQCDLPGCSEWKEVRVARKTFYCGDLCRQNAWDRIPANRERAKRKRVDRKMEAAQ